jgi:hypothetical protein
MVANKIELNGETILDLSQDTVTENDVALGVTFHLPSGEQGVGRMISYGSGVHVGSDFPPDEATVWIDPNGDATSTEEWEFEMIDGTTVTKTVVVTESEG